MQKTLSNKFVIFTLVLPGILMFFAAILFPIILSIYYGMTDSMGIGNMNFIGLKNYIYLLTKDEVFYKALVNSFLIGIAYIFIQHPICILFAIMLDRVSGKLEKFFRTVYFIPSVIAVVVVTKLWVYLYNPEFGVFNKILVFIGLGEYQQQWLGDVNLAFPSVLVMTIWIGFGWGLLMYYAGVKGIPNEMYEAAKIDGAGTVKIHTKITIPLLSPIIRVNIVLAMINALKQMEIIYISTDGGPANSTQVVANYLYSKAFKSFEFGYANAISVVFVVICLISTLGINKMFRRDVDI
ncbi:MAG: sugar ABC transporter permease [Vallitalea sp.]|jgi:raffinose/stachyose/melibiose transport system permease protein|nr:sugar ABC transporter permease [Vallitalea sp.]